MHSNASTITEKNKIKTFSISSANDNLFFYICFSPVNRRDWFRFRNRLESIAEIVDIKKKLFCLLQFSLFILFYPISVCLTNAYILTDAHVAHSSHVSLWIIFFFSLLFALVSTCAFCISKMDDSLPCVLSIDSLSMCQYSLRVCVCALCQRVNVFEKQRQRRRFSSLFVSSLCEHYVSSFSVDPKVATAIL